MTSANHCAQCGASLRDPGGRRVWTVFCSPEHALAWQEARTEKQIEAQASGLEGNDVCQWCRSPLRSGYHETGCPVRALVEARCSSSPSSTQDDDDNDDPEWLVLARRQLPRDWSAERTTCPHRGDAFILVGPDGQRSTNLLYPSAALDMKIHVLGAAQEFGLQHNPFIGIH